MFGLQKLVQIFVDYAQEVFEYNESNNGLNQSFDVTAWQEFYGNFSGQVILSDGNLEDLAIWNSSIFGGSIFIVDMESQIDWLSLIAVGIDSGGGESLDDFSDVDSILGMNSFNDSISKLFLEGGVPKLKEDLVIHETTVENVSLIDSGSVGTFFTGMLWDSSDDSNGEFDVSEKEDLVFVGIVNESKSGDHGISDYHVRIPVNLRSYDTNNEKEVYFYYDLS